MAVAAAAPGRAWAAADCALRVIPEHPSAAWDEAIGRARVRLASQSGDCDEVAIEVEDDFATVTFTTADGRRTVRVLHDPSEVSPMLDALLVTLPGPAPRPPTPALPPRAREPARETGTAEQTPSATQAHALLSALAGGRFAGPGPLLGPTLVLGASLGLPRWELGLVSQWTPIYAVLTDDEARPAHLAGISVGLAAGRRSPLGKNAALVTGMTLSAAAQHEGWHARDATTPKGESDRAQVLVGAYAATVTPTTARTRFRASLSGDVDATHLGDNGTPVNGVPRLPWWALSLAVGVESEVL